MFITFKVVYPTNDGRNGLCCNTAEKLRFRVPWPTSNPFPAPETAYLLISVFYVGVFAFPVGWILNSGFKVLWMLGRIVSLAKPRNFEENVAFHSQINTVNWACPVTDFCFTVSNFELVDTGAIFPVASCVFEIAAPSAAFFCLYFRLARWGTWTLRHS